MHTQTTAMKSIAQVICTLRIEMSFNHLENEFGMIQMHFDDFAEL